jgi:hypothetical protein
VYRRDAKLKMLCKMLHITFRSKGGLFAWETLRHFSSVILVEGLFDLAVLWQTGFRNTTCAIGTHLTPRQLAQLGDPPGSLRYLAFDHDENQADQGLLTASPANSPTLVSPRAWSHCRPATIPTAILPPALRPPTSPSFWSERNSHETQP